MDLFLFEKINGLAGKFAWLDALAIYGAEHFEYVLWFSVALLLLKNRGKYKEMLFLGSAAAILSRGILTELIRFLWHRPRPFAVDQITQLVEHVPTASLPSGHAAFYFAVSTVIYMYNKKAGIFFFAASFLIGLSRVFVGVHWPADILVGIVVGVFSAWAVVRIFSDVKSIQTKKER